MPTSRRSIRRSGRTLPGLAIVIGCVSVLAAMGVPRLIRTAERARLGEAFAYLTAIRNAQDRHQARSNTFAVDLLDLDNETEPPGSFQVPQSFRPGATGSLKDSWTLTLTRTGSLAGFGPYTVVFHETGFDPIASTVDRSLIEDLCRPGSD